MTFFSIFALFMAISNTAKADDISVVDVRRNITLSDDEPVFKDFYLSAGEGSALRRNMVVRVKRKVSVKEAPTKTLGDFDAEVGYLKIIQVGNKVSVAREFKLTPRDEHPMLQQIGIMSGDRIDMTGAYIDNSKPNIKHKSSDNEIKKEEGVQTAAVSSEERAPASTEPAKPNEPTLLQKIIPMPEVQ